MYLDDIVIESGDLSELINLYDIYTTYEVVRKKNTNIFRKSFNVTSLLNKYEIINNDINNKINSVNIEFINKKKRFTVESVINFFKFKRCQF